MAQTAAEDSFQEMSLYGSRSSYSQGLINALQERQMC